MMKLGRFSGAMQSKPVEQIDLNTGEVIKEWCSIAEASRKLRITKYYISNVLLGIRQEAGGFKWRYKNA